MHTDRLTESRLEILLIDDDEVLTSDMSALQLAQMHVRIATKTEIDVSLLDACDVVAVSLALPGALDLIERIAERPAGPVSIALVAPFSGRASLEFAMLRAELRGAAAAIPKPVDAIEIAYLAARLSRLTAAGGDSHPSDLETMLSHRVVSWPAFAR